jgi:alcohol dehydrogenase class IV
LVPPCPTLGTILIRRNPFEYHRHPLYHPRNEIRRYGRHGSGGFVEDLNARIGLPRSLHEMGVPASSIPGMALKAERDHSTATNPRPTTAADYAALLEKSIAV